MNRPAPMGHSTRNGHAHGYGEGAVPGSTFSDHIARFPQLPDVVHGATATGTGVGDHADDHADDHAPRAASSSNRVATGGGAVGLAVKDHGNAPTRADRQRQIVVTVSEVLCIVGTLVGMGVIGTRVEESSGGALAANATLLAPAGPAFSIWSVIYLGLLGYVLWQWLPANAARTRARATGYLAATSMLLNAAWLLVTQAGWLWVSVLVILALVVVLGELVRRLGAISASSAAERVLVDGTFGLYLGWVAVATCANITATLVASGVRPGDTVSQVLAVVVIAVAAALGVVLARTFGGRAAVAGAMAWGLAWIAVGRLTSGPLSVTVAIAAVLAAVTVVAATVRTRSDMAQRA